MKKKIVIVVGIILLYHFIFGDVSNRNVEIESIKINRINKEHTNSLYSVSLERDQLKINEFYKDELAEKFCKSVSDYYNLSKIISFNPLIVECEPVKEVQNVVITDGIKSRTLNYNTWLYDMGFKDIKESEIQLSIDSKLTIEEIELKYCKKYNLKLRKVIEFEPMEVACGFSDDAKKRYVTNGDWMYVVENHDFALDGHSDQYLVLNDYSLVNKSNGEIIKGNAIISNVKNIIGTATVSNDKRFFVSEYHGWWQNLVEIDKNGEKTELKCFFGPLLFKTPFTENMIASDDGNFLYLIISKSNRGSEDLYFYIIDVESKSTIFKKTLEKNKFSFNIYMSKQDGNVLFIYQVSDAVKAFKVRQKMKIREE